MEKRQIVRLIVIVISVFLAIGGLSVIVLIRHETESVCGDLREPLVFWGWSKLFAGKPDKTRAFQYDDVEATEFRASDGIILRGYKILGGEEQTATPNPKGYVLFAQGNAMLADEKVSYLRNIAKQGYDVYVYDYRGYGISDGKGRLKQIVNDYQELVADLNTKPYPKKILYGSSFGGIILINVIGRGSRYDKAILDSIPSRISHVGCPIQYDPVENLPDNSQNILLILGEKDKNLLPKTVQELKEAAGQKKALLRVEKDFAHSLEDKDPQIFTNRLNMIINFICEESL